MNAVDYWRLRIRPIMLNGPVTCKQIHEETGMGVGRVGSLLAFVHKLGLVRLTRTIVDDHWKRHNEYELTKYG
jgi:hypothetical protein